MESKNKDGIINSLGELCITSLGKLPETIGDKKTYTIPEVQLQKLIETDQPVLIDVMAVFLREDEGFPPTWLVNEPHESLPKSVWLPWTILSASSAAAVS